MTLLLAGAALAGPWTRSGGEAYVRVGGDAFLADQSVLPGIGTTAVVDFTGASASAYGEVGLPLPWKVMAVASVPLNVGMVTFERRDPFFDGNGDTRVVRMGDLRVGPQVALHPTLPLAAAVELKVPLYAVDGICDEETVLRGLCARPGDGQVDVTPSVLAGGSVGWGWVEGSVGYRFRTEAFLGWSEDPPPGLVDGVVASFGLGWKPENAYVIGRFDAVVNTTHDDWTGEAVRIGPVVGLEMGGGWAAEARVGADVWAEQASKGLAGGLGLSWSR